VAFLLVARAGVVALRHFTGWARSVAGMTWDLSVETLWYRRPDFSVEWS